MEIEEEEEENTFKSKGKCYKKRQIKTVLLSIMRFVFEVATYTFRFQSQKYVACVGDSK